METGWWVRCFQCGRQVDLAYVQRRQALKRVTTLENWVGLIPARYKHYGLVDMCPDCAQHADVRAARQRTLIAAALIALATFLCGWGYLAIGVGWAATGAAVVTLLCVLARRPRPTTALVPDTRRRYED